MDLYCFGLNVRVRGFRKLCGIFGFVSVLVFCGSAVSYAENTIDASRVVQICSNKSSIDQDVPFFQSHGNASITAKDLFAVGRCSSDGEFAIITLNDEPLKLSGAFNKRISLVGKANATILSEATFEKELKIQARWIKVEGTVGLKEASVLVSDGAIEVGSKDAVATLTSHKDLALNCQSFQNYGILQGNAVTLRASEIFTYPTSSMRALKGIQFMDFNSVRNSSSILLSGGDMIWAGKKGSSISNTSTKIYVNGVFTLQSHILKDHSETYVRLGTVLKIGGKLEFVRGSGLTTGKLVVQTRSLKLPSGAFLSAADLFLLQVNRDPINSFAEAEIDGKITLSDRSASAFESNLKTQSWIPLEFLNLIAQTSLGSVFRQYAGLSGLKILSDVDLRGRYADLRSSDGVYIQGKKQVDLKGFITNRAPEYKKAEVLVSAVSAQVQSQIQSTQNVFLQATEDLRVSGTIRSDAATFLTAAGNIETEGGKLQSKGRVQVSGNQSVSLNGAIHAPQIQVSTQGTANIGGTLTAATKLPPFGSSGGSHLAIEGKGVHIRDGATLQANSAQLQGKSIDLQGRVDTGLGGTCLSADCIDVRGAAASIGPVSMSGNRDGSKAIRISGNVTGSSVLSKAENTTVARGGRVQANSAQLQGKSIDLQGRVDTGLGGTCLSAECIDVGGTVASTGAVTTSGSNRRSESVRISGKMDASLVLVHAKDVTLTGTVNGILGTEVDCNRQFKMSESATVESDGSVSLKGKQLEIDGNVNSRTGSVGIKGSGDQPCKSVSINPHAKIRGKTILVKADHIEQESGGELSGVAGVGLDGKTIQIAGTVVSDSGCVQVTKDALRCERVDILASAKIQGQGVVLKTEDMTLDGRVKGNQEINLEWSNYDPNAFHGKLSTGGRCTIEGNIASNQALDLIADGRGGQITMNEIAVGTSQRVTVNRDIQARHGIVLKAREIQIEKLRKMRTTDGSIDLEAQAGSLVMEEESKIYAPKHVGLAAACDVLTTAVEIESGSLGMKAGRNVVDKAYMVESRTVTEGPGVSEDCRRKKAHVSRFKVKDDTCVEGQNIVFEGTRVDADSIQLQAKDKIVVLGVQESSTTSKRTEEKTGAWFWEGKEVKETSESQVNFVPAQLKSNKPIQMKAKEVTLQAPKLDAPETLVDADQVKLLQGKNAYARSSIKKSENAFWMSVDTKEEQHQTYTAPEICGQLKLKTSQIEIEQVQGKILDYVERLEFDPKQVEVLQTLVHELHDLKEKSISAPGPALVVAVAVAMSIATAGTGGVAVAGLGMKAASLAGTMASAAISSLTAQVATQVVLGVLAQQSPGDVLKQILRPETLKNVVTSGLTAGALCELQSAQEAAGTSDILRRVENAGAQAGVGMATNLAFGGQSLEEALKSAGVQFVSQAASSMIANQIGSYYANKRGIVDRGLHKLAHGASAAAIGAGGAALTGGDVASASGGAAAGAMTSEIVAELLAQPLQEDVLDEVKKKYAETGRSLSENEIKEILDQKVAEITQIAKLTGVVSGLLTGQADGVSAASSSATNAIENNYIAAAMPALWARIAPALMKVAGHAVVALGISSALDPANQPKAVDADQKKGGEGDSAGQTAKDFEKSLVGLPPGERVAKVRQKAASVAEENGWTKNRDLSKKNDRTIYTDKNGDHYSVDTQHGTIEKLNSRGKHLGELDMDLKPIPKSQDPSGRHDIEI